MPESRSARRRRIAVRLIAIAATTCIITVTAAIQPLAGHRPAEVPISELIGRLPLYPDATLVIDESEHTFTVVTQAQERVLRADYTPPLVASYLPHIADAGVAVEVRADRSESKFALLGVLVLVCSAAMLTVGYAARRQR